MLARHRVPVAGLTLAASLLAGAAPATAARAERLDGKVVTGDRPLAGAQVRLYAGGATAVERLGADRTGARGGFRISYRRPPAGTTIYAVASGGRTAARRVLRLMAVAGPAGAAPRRLAINELTTVAAAYSLARFLSGSRLAGPSPGRPNAALTVPSLVRTGSGRVGAAIARRPNGSATGALATLRTLAAILGGCTRGTAASCDALLNAARPPRGPRPANTLAAIHAIALNPANHVRRIFRLPRSRAYQPTLPEPPSSWVLSLKHTDKAARYDGPGRMAFDSAGNIWVSNNFQKPGTAAGLYVVSLDPAGRPRNGGAVFGGGIQGNWWGIAVDRRDRVWLSNFTGDDPNEFYSPDFAGGDAASLFTADAQPLSGTRGFTAGGLKGPQGIAVDQHDNVWIANHVGNTVTMYPGGDPAKARVITGGGLFEPFAVAIDAQGNAWVDNGAIDVATPGTLTKITPSGQAIGPFPLAARSPQGMAIDSGGDIWVATLADSKIVRVGPDGAVRGQFQVPSIEGGWGVAVDGDDNVWVASFLGETITLLCGRIVANCPPGAKTGDPISPPRTGLLTGGGLQHLTAVQVDQSGNVWLANNWRRIAPTVGGDGLVELIGAAPPVATPMIGPPAAPGPG